MYEIKTNIHRWKQGNIVSEEELFSEGVDIFKWENEGHISKIGTVKPVKVEAPKEIVEEEVEEPKKIFGKKKR